VDSPAKIIKRGSRRSLKLMALSPTEIARLRQKDCQVSWKPFTDMRDYMQSDPHLIVSGEGNWLIDAQGRRLFDAVSSLWCNLFGHRVPEIDAAIAGQLGRVAHTTALGPTHPGAVELAGRLIDICPGNLARVFFSDSGSEAVEAALKMAIGFQRYSGRENKTKIVSLVDGYHGDTMGAVSVGGIDVFHAEWRALCFESIQIPAPTEAEPALAALRDLLEKRGGEIAALIMEPRVQAAGMMLFHEAGFLAEARRLTRQHNVLLILDEVATGFGRTAKCFACQHENVVPDILCVAKGITGGYLPLAATVASPEVFQAFLAPNDNERRVFFHGHTYTANPLGCAAALAALDLLDKQLPTLEQKAVALRVALEPLCSLKRVRELRLLGLIGCIELVPGERQYAFGKAVAERALEHGILMRPLGDLLIIMPPLTVSEEEMQHLAAGLTSAIEEAQAQEQ
jgi:adenosylmethionine---8-amino-7-oxononanoate aminotransferase